jgi:NTE family protein
MQKTLKKRRVALVLQGGGAFGAYECGAVKALYEDPTFAPDIVTGVSIGAITAALLVGARGDPIETLEEMWRNFSLPGAGLLPREFAAGLSLFGMQGLYQVSPTYLAAPLLATSIYDTQPLYASLGGWVDFDKLNGAKTVCVVAATDIETGQLVEFSNREKLTASHIVASASLPPLLPFTVIDGRGYWDGGLIVNTPLRSAINGLERLDQGDTEIEREVIVIDLFERTSRLPQNMGQVIERGFELLLFGKFQLDMKLYGALSSYLDLIREIDAELAPDCAIRQRPAYRRLMSHRRIERLTVISSSQPESLGGPADFSRGSIERRLDLGYQDAQRVLRHAREV